MRKNLNIYTIYPELGMEKKKKSNPLCTYSRVSTALGIAPAGEMPESQGWHAGDGIVRLSGTSAPRRRGLGRKEGFTRVLQNQGEAGNSGGKSDDGERPIALLRRCLRFPTDSAKGLGAGWGKFHKLNSKNIEEGGGGEDSDSPKMFSSERCFLLLL